MKVAIMFGKGKAGLIDKPDPEPKRGFVVVKVHAIPMCTECREFQQENDCDEDKVAQRSRRELSANGGPMRHTPERSN